MATISELEEAIKQLRIQISVYLPVSRIVSQEIEQWFKVESIYHAVTIVGGEFERQDIRQILETESAVANKPIKDHLFVLNYAKALDWVRRSSQLRRSDINEQIVFSLHQLAAFSGDEHSQQSVNRQSYQVPYVLSEFSDWLQQTETKDLSVIAEAHYRLVSSQAFPDNANQTSWLLAQLLLMQAGLPVVYLKPEENTLYLEAISSHSSDALEHLFFGLIVRSMQNYLEKLRPEQKPVHFSGELLRIGQLADLTAESVPTIRYWTQLDLLSVADETEAGYQLYSQEMVGRVHEVRRLQKEERLKLKEIRQKLHANK